MRNYPNLWTGGTVGMTLRVPNSWRKPLNFEFPRSDAELEGDWEGFGLSMGGTLGLDVSATYFDGESLLFSSRKIQQCLSEPL